MRTSPRKSSDAVFRVGTDIVNRKVGTIKFFFLVKTDPDSFIQDAVDNKTAGECKNNRQSTPSQLGKEADSANTSHKFLPENSGGNTPPSADHTVQRPYSENIIYFELLLFK